MNPSGQYLAVGDRLISVSQAPLKFRIALIDLGTLQPIRRPVEVPERALRLDGPWLSNPQASGLSQFSLDRVALLRDGPTEYMFAGTLPCKIAASIPEELRSRVPITGKNDVHTPLEERTRAINAHLYPRRHQPDCGNITIESTTWIFVASQDVITTLAPNGLPLLSDAQRTFTKTDSAADFRGATLEFGVSADGRAVRFTDYRSRPEAPLTVYFNLRNVPHPISGSLDVEVFNPDQDRTIVQSWENSKEPRINSQALPAEEISKDEILDRLRFAGQAN